MNSPRHILHTALVWAFAAFMVISCSGGRPMSPLTPSITMPTMPQAGASVWAGRYLLGFWDIRISADRASAEVTPIRGASVHLNVLHMLEKECLDCLIINKVKILPPDELSADLTLKHPFAGQPRYTGFDVRGILIAGSDYEFPASGRKIALGDGQLRLTNADGYTSLFNPTEYPVNPDLPYMLQYTKGKYSMGDGPFDATLNPYLAYSKDKPRRMFAVGTSETRTVILALAPGELQFGYAVDASWVPVVGPVPDPVNDFPPEANCMEAYAISVTAGEVTEQTGGKGPVEAWVYDHQGAETIASVTAEVPDLFPGEFALSYTGDAPDGAFIFTGWVPNTYAATEGNHLMLIRVRDTVTDPNLGPIDAWQLSTIHVGEPPHGWARTWGGPDDDRGYGVAVDKWGNIYITGIFRYTVDFDPGAGEDCHTAIGIYGAYLSKFDPEGNFQWVRTWGGLTDTDSICTRGVTVDDSDVVYITGGFDGIIDFDPGPGEELHQSSLDDDVFLSKFDMDGNFLWVRVWGGTGHDEAWGLAADNAGNVYVTGDFADTVDFDPGDGVDEHTTYSISYIFLSSFDPDGAFLWARTWGGDGGSNTGYGASVDGFGNVFVTGVFSGTADFDPGAGEDIHLGNSPGVSAFLSKFDDKGYFLWARTWATPPEGSGEALNVAANEIGETFVIGTHHGIVDFDPGTGEDIHTANKCALFLTSFNPDGDFRWARTWGDSPVSRGWGVAWHESGAIYVTGCFSGVDRDFDPGPGEDLHSAHGSSDTDFFLSKFSYNGDFGWARTLGGAGYDNSPDVVVNSSQSAYVTGHFSGPCDFDPGPGEDLHNGFADAFLLKILPDGYW